jgi:hypothetical protein
VLSAVVPAAALAATLPEVQGVFEVTDDVGRLEVRASSDSPITAIRASVLSPETREVLLVVDDFQLVDGQPERGVWQTPDTLKLPALGDYPVEVMVTDADGDQLPYPATGFLSYWITPLFESVTVSPTVVDLDHRTVTVAGQLLGRMPDTRALAPLGDAEIRVDTFYDFYPGRTDAEGRFSMDLTILAPTPIDVTYFPAPEHQTVRPASSEPVEVTVDVAPTRIIADVAPTSVNAGEEVVLSGRIEFQNAGAWHPYGGVTIEAQYVDSAFSVIVARDFLTSDADGRFQLTAVPFRSGYWVVEYAGIADYFHEPAVTVTPTVQVIQSSAITGFTASRQGRQVTVGGRLELSDPFVLPSAAIDIQYSRSGRDGWTTITTLTTEGEDHTFTGQVPFPGPGFLRAHFAGDSRDLPPATSDAVRVR